MNQYSILLVDDEYIIRKSISDDLRDGGYNVTTAENGKEAIRLFSERPKGAMFDLVITDLMMEGINGIEVLKEVKRIAPVVMVIILTGYGSLDSAVESIRLGVDDYMIKPLKRAELLFRVSCCLEKLELRRKIKLYEGLLPVCYACKKIRDDEGKEHGTGEWLTGDVFLRRRAKIDSSYTYCPECLEKWLQLNKID